MKKKILLVLACALILAIVGCSSNRANSHAEPEGNLIAITPIYDSGNNYTVTMPEEASYVPPHFTATEIVAPIFDTVRSFSNGYAVVGMGQVWNDEEWRWERGLYGLIDKDGNLVLPIIYDRIGDIIDTVAVDDCVFVIVRYNGKSGLLTVRGDEILPIIYTRVSIHNNLAVVSYGEGHRRTAGLFNISTGEFVIPKGTYVAIGTFIYDDAFGPWNGIAEVNYNDRWGLVDTEGNYVLEPIFDSMRHLQQYVWRTDFRYFPVSHNGVQDIWDMAEGRLAVSHMSSVILDIYSTFAIVRYGQWYDGLEGVINIETGEYVIPLGHMHFGNNNLRNGLTLVSEGSWGSYYKKGVVDIRTGEIVADFIYDDLRWEQGIERDYIIFQIGAERERRSWDGDYFYALLDGLFGVMDSYGNIIIPPIYSFIQHMHNSSDLFAVTLSCKQNGTKMGVINGSGEIILPIAYTHVGQFFHTPGFSTNFAPINIGAEWVWDNSVASYWGDGGHELRGGKWGFIDTSGNLIIPAELEYDLVYPVVDGMAAVRRDGKWGFVAVRPDKTDR